MQPLFIDRPLLWGGIAKPFSNVKLYEKIFGCYRSHLSVLEEDLLFGQAGVISWSHAGILPID
jgi:hypothetical protein